MPQDFKFPLRIEPEELDAYLAHGWYRMGQCIFTTDFVEREGVHYKAIWLRNRLSIYQASTSFQKLKKRNKNFTTEIIPFNYNSTYEKLFQQYRLSLPPERVRSLHSFLFGDSPYLIFNSVVINLYDAGKLIGAGVFDLGKTSAAGISSFYDPAYQKFSIGRYLIFKKIEYCKRRGYDYFYPGYFVEGIKAFDYKLEIGKESLEYYNMREGAWKPISTLSLNG